MDNIPEPPPVRRPRNGKVMNGEGESSRPPLPSIRRPRTVGGRTSPVPLVPWRTVGIVAAVAVALALLVWLVLPGILSEDRAQELDTAIAQAEAQLGVAGTAERDRKSTRLNSSH